MSRVVLRALILLCVLAPTAALAHPGHGGSSLTDGLVHPITGLDHVLAMVAVGLLSAQLGGRAVWLTPLTFLGVLAVGGALGMAGVNLPFAETGIVLSVIVLGLAVALSLSLPTLGAMALVGLFAVFHGYAHGAEMPGGALGLPYAAGFLTTTALLIGVGVGLGLLTSRRAVQVAGGAMAALGVAILSGVI